MCKSKNGKKLLLSCVTLDIRGRIRSDGFLNIFTVVFLLFLATAGGSNPEGPIS